MIKKYLPLFVRPFKDELLSSWLMRNALSHEIKFFTFCKYLFHSERPYYGDVDKFLPKHLSKRLHMMLPVKPYEVERMSLRSFNSFLFMKDESIWNYNFDFVIPLGPPYKRTKSKSIMYCPICLAEEAYFRLNWRLSLFLYCTKHHIRLLDECSMCSRPVQYTRINAHRGFGSINLITICFYCGFDLRHSTLERANNIDLNFQREIETVLTNGYNKEFSYSFHFFQGIASIISNLTSNQKRKNELLIRSLKEFGINELNFQEKINFSSQTIESRRQLIRIIQLLLSGWPDNFLKVLNDSSLTKSYFFKDCQNNPYWIDSILNQVNSSRI